MNEHVSTIVVYAALNYVVWHLFVDSQQCNKHLQKIDTVTAVLHDHMLHIYAKYAYICRIRTEPAKPNTLEWRRIRSRRAE